MSTFLELCQEVARESGTMTGGASSITTVVDQSGRAGTIVKWTANAWRAIQTMRPTWKWMAGQFEAALTIGQQAYTGAGLTLTRHAAFVADNEMKRVTLYDPALGYSDEGYLAVVPYANFYPVYQVGSNRAATGKPQVASIADDGRLVLWPTPDKAYKLRGWRRLTPQVLAADDDVPECPEAFHDIISWRALLYLGQYDEAVTQFPFWNVEFRRLLGLLEQDQLPAMELPGALA